ncbi:DEAD/DEAH box helicase [Pelagicoccus mobilis]|uniref:DEAD/DEAH box helicase n=1 Tax=Pelagicoccus mobilis TaxID=415221 RepID=A0A934VND3_9BACT|nr:DEAD/DEAH box helicase [Pelagicoccus mobilis]MBK1879816.1 DEAD/DEAH box helicase [Pelagicoccus mobilis]
MDPFVFDQRFARFVGQVGTAAASKGTELYDSGAVRVDALGKGRIRGSVHEKREGSFQVTLTANDDGGLSGSCSCPEFFNCAHAYALARAARERIVGAGSGASRKGAEPEKSLESKEWERIWKLSKGSGHLLYPKDLYKLVSDRRSLGVSGREPIRALKRALQKENPQSVEAFAEVVVDYFEFKGIGYHESYRVERSSSGSSGGFEEETKEGRNWDRPALKLRARIRLEESADRDWFQASAVWEIEGGGFSKEDIEKLREAGGGMVKLGDKGWFRLGSKLPENESRALSSLGLDPDRGNAQRVHLCQVEDLLPKEMLEEKAWSEVKRKAERLREIGEPEVPAELRKVLRPYQVAGFRYLARLSELGLGGVLADDMGLGKTLQTLAWMLWLSRQKGVGFRALVICPKSVCDNWVQEPGKFKTGLRAKRFRNVDDDWGGANIVVANYAQLRIRSDYFLGEDWDAVVLDEAQYIKSPTSQTSKVAYKLKGSHRIALTGTPIENSLTDLWSIMRFAMPRLFGPLASFKANYEGGERAERLGDLRKRMRPFLLRRLKLEVAKELPERIEEELYCELEGEQRSRYEASLAEARQLLKGAKRGAGNGAFNVLQALLRLRQICCDLRLVDEDEEGESAKMQAMLDLVEPLVEEGHRVLVFSQFVKLLEIAERTLSSKKIKYLKLTGQTGNRGELVKRFQSEDAEEQVFLLSLKAAGSGLTLTAASYVVLLDPWWNPAVEAQAIDRAHRIGQRNQVIAYRILTKDTVEEKIRKIQKEKAELAAALFGEGAVDAKVSLEELEEVLG